MSLSKLEYLCRKYFVQCLPSWIRSNSDQRVLLQHDTTMPEFFEWIVVLWHFSWEFFSIWVFSFFVSKIGPLFFVSFSCCSKVDRLCNCPFCVLTLRSTILSSAYTPGTWQSWPCGVFLESHQSNSENWTLQKFLSLDQIGRFGNFLGFH